GPDGQPGLPAAARPCQGQQPARREGRPDRLQLGRASDEGRQLPRQPTHHLEESATPGAEDPPVGRCRLPRGRTGSKQSRPTKRHRSRREPGTMTEQDRRRVVANLTISLDGYVTGPGGDADMSWVAKHAVSDQARDIMTRIVNGTTAVLGRRN